MFKIRMFKICNLLQRGRSSVNLKLLRGIKYMEDERPEKLNMELPESKVGGENLVTLITGSTTFSQQGSAYISTLFQSARVPVKFERITLDPGMNTKEYYQSAFRNRFAIHIDLQHDPEQKKMNLLLNNVLDLRVCSYNFKSYCGFNCIHQDLDIALVTQNNTGDFAKLEYGPVKGMIETLRFGVQTNIRNFLRYVFKYAVENKRKCITFAHKMDVLPKSDGLFLDIAHDIRDREYPDMGIIDMNVNKLVRLLIMDPKRFDMICTTDQYGTFVASICSAVCGGAGLHSVVESSKKCKVFRPLQSKLSITNQSELSPYATVITCIDLLHHLGKSNCAQILCKELHTTMFEHKIKTAEFGGTNTGAYVICNIANRLRCQFDD